MYNRVTKNPEPGNPCCDTSLWLRAHGCLLPARRTETVPRKKDRLETALLAGVLYWGNYEVGDLCGVCVV